MNYALLCSSQKECKHKARQSRSKRALRPPLNPPPPTTLFFVGATYCHLVTSEAVSSKATVANAVKLKLRVAT